MSEVHFLQKEEEEKDLSQKCDNWPNNLYLKIKRLKRRKKDKNKMAYFHMKM